MAKHSHPRTEDDRAFYYLPAGLLESILQALAEKGADDTAIQTELDAADARLTGHWHGRPIRSAYLTPPRSLTALEIPASVLGWTEEELRSAAALGESVDAKLEAQREPVVGYLGWLASNPTFVAEHDDLLGDHAGFLQRNGLPKMGAIGGSLKGMKGPDNYDAIRGNKETTGVVDDFEEFYVRWRLQDLDGPYLPNPLAPQLPVYHLPAVLGHMKSGGQTFYFPDTFPLPSRDQLRNVIEENLRSPSDVPEHLKEWTNLVGTAQTAKNQIARYARLFPLQHYVRALYQRHEQALSKAKGRLNEALGKYFMVSADTIKGDMSLLAERLGSGWETAPRAF